MPTAAKLKPPVLGVVAFLICLIVFLFLLSRAANPISWDELLYMNAAYFGQFIDEAPLRSFHVLLLWVFNQFFADPFVAAKIWWSALASFCLLLPSALCFWQHKEMKPQNHAFIFITILLFSLSYDYWSSGLGIAYAEFTSAFLFSLTALCLCLSATTDAKPALKPEWASALMGAIFACAITSKETNIFLLAAPFICALLQTQTNRQHVLRLYGFWLGGVAIASFCLLLLFVFVLQMPLTDLGASIAAWQKLNLNVNPRSELSYIKGMFSFWQPGFYAGFFTALLVGVAYKNRLIVLLGTLVLLHVAALQMASFISSSVPQIPRYMVPNYGVVMLVVALALAELIKQPRAAALLIAPIVIGLEATFIFYDLGVAAFIREQFHFSPSILQQTVLMPVLFLGLMLLPAVYLYSRTATQFIAAMLISTMCCLVALPNADAVWRADLKNSTESRFTDIAGLITNFEPSAAQNILYVNGFFTQGSLKNGAGRTRLMLQLITKQPIDQNTITASTAIPDNFVGWVFAPENLAAAWQNKNNVRFYAQHKNMAVFEIIAQ